MKLHLATACALASLALAGSAFAEARVSATLETPKPAKTKLIAAHAVFVCKDATCVAGLAPDDAASVSGCKDLAKKVGRLSAYGNEYKTLSAEQLATCNAAAPASTGTAQAAN
jgi:predicted metal-binding protein